jgi:hypothetical protein
MLSFLCRQYVRYGVETNAQVGLVKEHCWRRQSSETKYLTCTTINTGLLTLREILKREI